MQQPLATPPQQPFATPSQQGYERMDKEPARRDNPNKGPSPLVLMLLLSLIPVMFCVALGIRYMTRGPRVVHHDGPTTPPDGVTTTTAAAIHTTHHTNPINPPPPPPTNLTVPYQPKPGTEQYSGALPTDLEPVHHSVTIVLNGTALKDPKLKVNGKAEAQLKVAKATQKVILKADPATIKELKMALLDGATPPNGMNITTLSVSTSFLIADLDKPLELGKTYTLLTEYEVDKTAPITVTADFAKMQLKKDSANQAFPCFEKPGWNIPVTLTLYTPPSLVAVSNAPQDGQPTTDKTFSVQKFKATVPMPPDMLAWSVFPNTLKPLVAVPNKVSLYMKTQNADLQKAAKTAFEFLPKYFEDPAHEHIAKIDFVFTKPTDAQDSLGLIILDEATKPEDLCAKMASQWTAVLTQPPATGPWLSSAGVKYLCLLAGTDDSHLAPLFMKDLKECMATTPSAGTRELLVFRMAHIILGDTDFQKALQSYVTKNIFNSTTTDIEHGAFAPLVKKEYVTQWLKEGFKVKKLTRDFTAPKKLKWTAPEATNTPFASSTDKGAISLRTPASVAVEWLNSTTAELPVIIEDTKPLYVNPSMMACYGIELDNKSWALIGQDMETKAPDAINGWYLLGQAAKQFETIKAPHDFSGFMWMWAALKSGDKDLWDDHVKQFIDTEKQAYSMLTTPGDVDKYKKRIEAVIKTRLDAITSVNITAANKGKTPVLLANLACQMGMAKCGTLLPATVKPTDKIDKDFTAEPLDAEAVACYIGSKAEKESDFDRLELPATPPTGKEATLSVRLAFCGCVNATVAQDPKIKPKIDSVYKEALDHTWDAATAAATRPPLGLRDAALAALTTPNTPPVPEEFKKVLKSAATLKLAFTATNITKVKQQATANHLPDTDADLTALEQAVIPDKPALLDWVDYPHSTP